MAHKSRNLHLNAAYSRMPHVLLLSEKLFLFMKVSPDQQFCRLRSLKNYRAYLHLRAHTLFYVNNTRGMRI